MTNTLFHVFLEHRVTGRCTVKLTKKPVPFKQADDLVRLYKQGNTRHATMREATP